MHRLALLLALFIQAAVAAEVQVAATVGMLADAARAVGGDRVAVTGIIGTGVDPHLYQPTRGDAKVLMRSDVIFHVGHHLEGRMGDVLGKVSNSRIVVAVAESIDPAMLLEESPGHADPHVWNDLTAWAAVIDVIAVTLTKADAAGATAYSERAAGYKAELAKLATYGDRVTASVPKAQRVLITAHDAFNYFGRTYGFEVLGVQGISTESQAGLAAINDLVDVLVERKVPAIFVETSVSDKNIRALIEGAQARGHKVVIGGSLYSDAMGPAGAYTGTFLGMQDHNLTMIARALGGEAPATGRSNKLTVTE